MSNQVLRVTLEDNDPLIHSKVLGQIFIDGDSGKIDYIDSDGQSEHIVMFDSSCSTDTYMIKSVYDNNNDGIVDNTTALGGIPANQWATQAWVLSTATGDMTKTVYDTNDSGIVDNSERLGGQLPSYYASLAYVNSLPIPKYSELDDAAFGTQTSGDLIMFDGTNWCNTNMIDLGTF
jgi:hypothetical protein